ncbi:MAG: hypothetical protein HOD43_13640 [Candidatus Marinimicrobia bacterium]|nr:hypothetical protein [Candidatus Neomarinimicrobiota bacterium]MBT4419256.1 hypothetical protein [Candidatus Neomarinimicrobiota bacterium]MBT4993394.1 hypothetical protein [Candidatus Neomarinimicrobiota bacterium]MBT5464818.1 hypothetical protein [Candidatus Neomarinimicrobiota bacterium]MBT6003409.1 hypothetical protein [Candidatus Neomarinimicrobiota bacterium]
MGESNGEGFLRFNFLLMVIIFQGFIIAQEIEDVSISENQIEHTPPNGWDLNFGIGGPRGYYLLGLAKDIPLGDHLALTVTGGLGLQTIATGLLYASNYRSDGFLISLTGGYDLLIGVDFIPQLCISYQTRLQERLFLTLGVGVAVSRYKESYGWETTILPYPTITLNFIE